VKSGAVAKLAAVNLLVFAGILLGLLFVMSLAGDTYNFAKTFFPKNDKRADLPVYEDHEKARRIFNDQRQSNSRYVPFAEWRQPKFASENLNIDENGYRMHSIGMENDANAQTLGFYGASTVWGTGVGDNDTLPAQFDKITTQFNVMNYSERGYTSTQNLIDLVMQINTNSAPKNVIFYGGLNDIAVDCNLALTKRLNSHGTENRIQNALDRTANEYYLYNNLIAPIIALASSVLVDSKGVRIAGCSDDPKRADEVAELFVKNLEIMDTLVKAYGGRFHAFLQPSAYIRNPRIDYINLDNDSFAFDKAQVNAVIPLVLSKLSQRRIDWFSDLSGAFDGNEYYLIDHVHASPKGNAVLARLIAEKLH
jgi:lysophospholipase L1-like esterase